MVYLVSRVREVFQESWVAKEKKDSPRSLVISMLDRKESLVSMVFGDHQARPDRRESLAVRDQRVNEDTR